MSTKCSYENKLFATCSAKSMLIFRRRSPLLFKFQCLFCWSPLPPPSLWTALFLYIKLPTQTWIEVQHKLLSEKRQNFGNDFSNDHQRKIRYKPWNLMQLSRRNIPNESRYFSVFVPSLKMGDFHKYFVLETCSMFNNLNLKCFFYKRYQIYHKAEMHQNPP